jgi:hypothetical protein
MSYGAIEPNYKDLQVILKEQLGRGVGIDEATGVGKFLLNTYEVLLSDDVTSDTIKTDTT